MVIVYSSQETEDEYLRYIRFLQRKGYLEQKEPEIVEVEDLQGVYGLRALRIGIDYHQSKEASDFSLEELIAEV